jgi:hypothetical protein
MFIKNILINQIKCFTFILNYEGDYILLNFVILTLKILKSCQVLDKNALKAEFINVQHTLQILFRFPKEKLFHHVRLEADIRQLGYWYVEPNHNLNGSLVL